MMAAILTCGLGMTLTSCVDYVDNPAPSSYAANESQEQTAFWEKFNQWQTDSCSVGDDFFMHMTGKFWWNPTTIYPDGLMPYAASEMFGKTVTLTDDTGDPDLKTILLPLPPLLPLSPLPLCHLHLLYHRSYLFSLLSQFLSPRSFSLRFFEQ